MGLWDVLKLAMRVFKTNKMRTMLTILGIGIGIGTILFLVSLGYGLEKVVMDKIAKSDALLSIDVMLGSSKELGLNSELVDKIMATGMASDVSFVTAYKAQVEANEFNGSIDINFVKPLYFDLSGKERIAGNFFDSENKEGLVVTTAILKLFNLSESAIDKNEKINLKLIKTKNVDEKEGEIELVNLGSDFYISGILKDDNSPLAYANISNINENEIKNYDQLKIKASDKTKVEPLKEYIFNMGYSVSSISETIDQAGKIFSVAQLVLAIFGIIALIVSAIGMFNTMTIALLQRTREIGIMKSIGAKNKDIKILFLTESMVIGFLGGISGIILSYSLAWTANFFLNMLANVFGGTKLDIFETPTWFLILVIIFSTVVGFLTGIWPAIRASKLNPLEALRYK